MKKQLNIACREFNCNSRSLEYYIRDYKILGKVWLQYFLCLRTKMLVEELKEFIVFLLGEGHKCLFGRMEL